MRQPHPVTIEATLQDHRTQRESWAVATVLVHAAKGELPFGFCVGSEVCAVGDRLGLAAPGERLELSGRFESSKFGQQLRVLEQISQGVKEPKEAARWLERLDGVGPVLARQLLRHFGNDLLGILNGEIEADLTVIQGISDEKARHIIDSFAELAIAGDLESVQFLDSIGASRYEVTKILQWCKQQRRRPIDVLEGAPYDLMQVKGLGFMRVDRLAKAAGCPFNAPARIEAATMHQLGVIVDRGSTMAPLYGGRDGGLIGETAALLGVDKDLARQGAMSLAARGKVVMAEDDRGRPWVHPAWLLTAEREIYRAAKGVGPKPAGVVKAAEPEIQEAQAGRPHSPPEPQSTPAAGPLPRPAAGPGRIPCWCSGPCVCNADALAELRALGAAKRAAERAVEDGLRIESTPKREKVTHVWE